MTTGSSTGVPSAAVSLTRTSVGAAGRRWASFTLTATTPAASAVAGVTSTVNCSGTATTVSDGGGPPPGER